MGKLLLTPAARQSIFDLARYVAQQSQSRSIALELVDMIMNRCKRYAEFPKMGQVKNFLPDGVRYFQVRSYIVVYQPREDGIVVLFVSHASRNIPSVLRDLIG